MLARLRERGISILVSTPYMDEAGRCDRIALIESGRILEVDTLEGILERHDQPLYAVHGDRMLALLHDLRAFPGTESCLAFGDCHHLALRAGTSPEVLDRYLVQKGHVGATVRPIRPGIEDVFIALGSQPKP
jgi:ABC-type multidrug transport system ATPase subunit